MVTPIKPNPSVSVTDKDGKPQRDWINYWNDVASNATGANPSGTIGLTAVNGSASTYLRSDAAPALSQAITPVWTGTHEFALGLRFSGDQVTDAIVGASAFSTTYGINFNNVTFNAGGWAFGTSNIRLWGDGYASIGYGETPISGNYPTWPYGSTVPGMPIAAEKADMPAVLNVYRNPTYTGTSGDANEVRSAIRATAFKSDGQDGYNWSILGYVHNFSDGTGDAVGVYCKADKWIDGHTWGAVSEIHDKTGADPANATMAHEFNLACNGTDANDQRIFCLLMGSQDDTGGARGDAANGILITSRAAESFKYVRGIQLSSANSDDNFDYGIDTEIANISTEQAIRTAASHMIAFAEEGRVQMGVVPATAWQLKSKKTFTIANNGTSALAAGAGLVLVHDQTHNASGLYLCCGGSTTMVSQNGGLFVNGAVGAGFQGVVWSGSAYVIDNKYGSTVTYAAMCLATQNSN
jgi:hypothetical protein